MQAKYTLISPQFIVPIEPAEQVYTEHSVVIDDAGKIVALLPTKEACLKYVDAEEIELNNHVIMPGLVNAHTHSPMTMFRGMADDLPLMTWLIDHMWPAERRYLNNEFVEIGTKLAICEMLKGGTTCIQEHYPFSPVIAKTVADSKMRGVIGLFMIKHPTAWAENIDQCIVHGEKMFAEYENNELVTINLAPHAPYSMQDEDLAKMMSLAREHNSSIQMHVHESEQEIQDGLKEYGMRPLARLEKLGVFSAAQNFSAVHMVHLNNEDFALLKNYPQISVVHCPESNLKLGHGFCPVAELIAAGSNVCLGTDSAASNNDLDMLLEMRTAALIAKGAARNPTTLPAFQALEMATLNGAKALGLEDKIGSLVPGKMADLIAVDLSAINTQPVYNPISHLVYAISSSQVSDVWIGGRRLVKSGKITHLDSAKILEQALEIIKK